MRLTITALALIATTIPVAAEDKPPIFNADLTCKQWIADHSSHDQVVMAIQNGYILGFIDANFDFHGNQHIPPEKYGILLGNIPTHCKQHPNDTVITAAGRASVSTGLIKSGDLKKN